MWIEIILGILFAFFLLWVNRKQTKIRQLKLWAIGLFIVALIYVGFALVAGNWEWLPLEAVSVLIYGLPAILAIKYSPWWLVFGWVGHVLWDVLLHGGGYPGFVPHWYPGVCVGFDLTIAIYWIFILRNEAFANP